MIDDKELKEKLDTMTGTVRYLGIVSERLGAQATRDADALKSLAESHQQTQKLYTQLVEKQRIMHARVTWTLFTCIAILLLVFFNH